MFGSEKKKRARQVYETLCAGFDEIGWRYDKEPTGRGLVCRLRGEDLTISLHVRVEPEQEQVIAYSRLPYFVREDKRTDVALAICHVNNRLRKGAFRLDLRDGELIFRTGNSICDIELSPKVFVGMILGVVTLVDKYNDKFFMLITGALTLEQFLADEQAD